MSNPRANRGWSLQQKIGASFSLVLVFLLVVVFVAWNNMADYLLVANRTSETHQVLESLNRLSDDMHKSIADQRSYLLTGNKGYYADYSAALLRLDKETLTLDELIHDANQRKQFTELRELIKDRKILLNLGIARRETESTQVLINWVATNGSLELGRKIDARISEMVKNEQVLLSSRTREMENKSAQMIFSFIGGVSLVGVIMIGIYTIANRELKERLRVEKVMEESERRYALAALGTNDGLWDWKLDSNEIYFSPRWKIILGYQDNEIGNKPEEWFRLVHPDDIEKLKDHINEHLHGTNANFEYEYRMLHKEGDVRWVLTRGVSAYDDFGKPNRIAGSLSDITARKLDEERLLYEASHDALTGLYNRQFFMQQLEVEMSSAKRYRYPLSLCMGDLDRFKQINDVYGHLTGDNVLISFASLLKQQLRVQDMVGRFGGDEFCFYFPHTNTQDVQVLLERIREDFEKMVFVADNGEQFSLTCTFGVAALSADQKEGKDLIGQADQALYRAKEFRNRIEVIDESQDAPQTT